MEHFATQELDEHVIVERVKREAREECPPESSVYPVLDQCAQDAVTELWDSRIKTFVPLLALRRVRGCIEDGSCTTLSRDVTK